MKPQDIVILLKIITLNGTNWRMTDLASSLYLSQSEISKGLARLVYSGLIDETKKIPSRNALFDLITTSIQYIFPVKPGRILKGVVTSHSSSPLSSKIVSDRRYVWPYIEGKSRGESIEPLYQNLPRAAIVDEKLHELLALVDVFRVGKARERKLAITELRKRLKVE